MSESASKPQRTTMVLSSDVTAWLDHQRAAMRAKTATCMSRSELLRAMVRASAELAVLNFENCRSEEDIGIEMFCGGVEAAGGDA